MDRSAIIGSPRPDLLEFLDIWNSDSPSIEAMTSGSTGTPKIIQLSKRDMRLSAEATCSFFGLGPDSVLGLVLPVDHIAGRMVVVRADVCGGKVYVEAPSSTPLHVSFPESETAAIPPVIDLLSIVPAQVQGLLDSALIGRVRAVLVGGAPLGIEQEKRLSEIGTIASYATYGMTETCSNVALRRLGQPVYVANDGFRFSTDRRGCLVIESERMSFGTIQTNDVVRLHDSCHFEWICRADNIINSGGIKLYPEKLEQVLSEILPEGHFCLVSRPSEKWGREMVLLYDTDISTEMRKAAERLLQRVERPKDWIRVTSLPRTANGKIRRKF